MRTPSGKTFDSTADAIRTRLTVVSAVSDYCSAAVLPTLKLSAVEEVACVGDKADLVEMEILTQRNAAPSSPESQ